MEQTIQKPPLPIKTKIAAWWMILLGGLGAIACVLFIKEIVGGSCWAGLQIPLILFFPSFLVFLSGIFILIGKKWARWLAFITLSVMMIIFVGYNFSLVINRKSLSLVDVIKFFSLTALPIIIPFILLLLDRKNFWKIAS
jgi:hypothetical protein